MKHTKKFKKLNNANVFKKHLLHKGYEIARVVKISDEMWEVIYNRRIDRQALAGIGTAVNPFDLLRR